MAQLAGKKIACVATNGFEWSELTEPKKALEAEGAHVAVIAPQSGEIFGETKGNIAGTVHVDKTIDDAQPEEYDALLLPGGVKNPDTLRLSADTIDFIRTFVDAKKPIAAICHGPWTLIDADAVAGKRVTSWSSLQIDLRNAGAEWLDEEAVVDGALLTSRKPADIPAFTREAIKLFASASAPRSSAQSAK